MRRLYNKGSSMLHICKECGMIEKMDRIGDDEYETSLFYF